MIASGADNQYHLAHHEAKIIGSGFRPGEVLSLGYDDAPGHRASGAEAAAQADATGRVDVEVVGAQGGVLEIEGDSGSVGITGYFDVDAGIANSADTPPAEDIDLPAAEDDDG